MSLREKLSKIKNNNPWLKYLWFKTLKRREREASKVELRERIIKRFLSSNDYEINLDCPKTFYDKLNWLKLYYRNDLMPIVTDKYEVRQYLEKLGYEYLLNDLLGVWDDVQDIDISSLPQKFVLKATHGSGPNWIKVVNDKSKVNWFAEKLVMNQWLNNNIAWMGGEWQYKNIKARIIAEEYLEDETGELRDYKFHCFNGEIKFISVFIGRFTKAGKKQYTMDKNWKLIPLSTESVHTKKEIDLKKPDNFNEMVSLAQELSKPYPYVRVDFYNVRGKIYFGEFTFTHDSGFGNAFTKEAQELIGSWLVLPNLNHG